MSVAQDRSPSPVIWLDRLGGRYVIAPRRSNSAHLHRSWRAIYATAKASLACAASSRILAATPRRFGSQPKISKTTPCKVAGGRRHGRFGPTLDTSGQISGTPSSSHNPSNARGCDFCEEAMAPLWQAWPIHRTAEVHATSRCSAATSHFLCSLSAIAHSKP